MLHTLPPAEFVATLPHTPLQAPLLLPVISALLRCMPLQSCPMHWRVLRLAHPCEPVAAQPALASAERVSVPSSAQDFNKVIYASFAAMAVVYGLVAGLGYYYFGDAASTLVTNDLATNSPYTGRWVHSQASDGRCGACM